MEDEKITYFERRLVEEIGEIEAKMKALDDEKRALLRQLAKARAERTGIQNVTRKNSLNRVLAENCIFEALRESGVSVSTVNLYRKARFTNFDLKENTFRTYLHRMKKRGAIRTGRTVGTWELAKQP